MRTTKEASPTTILIVGTAKDSFGDYIVRALHHEMDSRSGYDYSNWRVVAAGIHEGAELRYDVQWPLALHVDLMNKLRPHHVVFAAGANFTDDDGSMQLSADIHFQHNAAPFLQVAEAFQRVAYPGSQLVAISSNSARIPRSPSLGYCMSKAALSMAVRVLARRWQGEPMVYGYEPGLMGTQATIDAVNRGVYKGAAHRMRGVGSPYGLNVRHVATMVAQNLLWGGMHLNGALLQTDAGEL